MGIMNSIHCLSLLGKVNDEHITIVCSEEKICEIKKELVGARYYKSTGTYDPSKGLKVFWCGATYVFISHLNFNKQK